MRRCNDLIKMDYPLWFADLENYEPDEKVELVEMLLDLKENVKEGRRVDNEDVFAYVSIKDSHPNIFKHVETSIVSCHVESGFSAVVDVFCRKRNKLDPNGRGTIRLRLNNFIKIDYILCQGHQDKSSH